AAFGIGAGDDDVAFVDDVADIERDGDAVALHGDLAADLLNLSDRIRRWGSLTLGLRVFMRRRGTGEQFDYICRKMRAVRRRQSGRMLVGEIFCNNVMR